MFYSEHTNDWTPGILILVLIWIIIKEEILKMILYAVNYSSSKKRKSELSSVFLHFKWIIKISLNIVYMQIMDHKSSGAKTDQQVKYAVYKRLYMV